MQKLLFIAAALYALLLVSVVSAQVAGPDRMIKGVNFVRASSTYPYNSKPANQSLSRLKDSCGVNWVAVVPVWWMSDTGSASVFWMQDLSPSDDEVRAVIRHARTLGLKVLLKPEVRCLSGIWQGEHDPKGTAWFASYRSFLLRYAGIARDERCAMLSIGTALDRTADENWEKEEWLSIIQATRGIYSGPLVYGADWRRLWNVGFWDSLDYIGIEAFFPLDPDSVPDLGGTQPLAGSVEYYAQVWKRRWVPDIESFLHSRLTDTLKPVIFTGVGYRSVAGAAQEPWNRTLNTDCSPTEQRNCYIACLHSLLGRPWFSGWFWTEWSTDPGQAGPEDKSYTPRGKPAQTVLCHWNHAIGTHRAATVFTHLLGPADFYSGAGPTLDSLVSDHANWVAISPWWFMKDTTSSWDTIAPDSYYSPSDSSMRTAIRLARGKGLRVMLAPHLLVLKKSGWEWTNGFNPASLPADGLQRWFCLYRDFIVHYAAFAEEESCDLYSVGNELNHTTDHPAEVACWRDSVVPAVRAVYSGPLTYNAFWSFLDYRGNGPHENVDTTLWAALDFAGINAYFQLYPKEGYAENRWTPAETSRLDQRPKIEDLTERSELSWDQNWLPRLDSLYRVLHKPVLFTEIGYGSFDSVAWYTSGHPALGWSRLSVACTADLYSVCFPLDTLTGYVVGAGGKILKTTNVGNSWQSIPSGTSSDLFAVHFPVLDTGYAVGEDGTILKITPGAVSALGARPLVSVVCLGVHFPKDAQTGYVVGYKDSTPSGTGVILKTTDGGGAWQRYSWPEGQQITESLRAVHFPSEFCGYAVGDNGVVLKTTNAGVTWTRLNDGLNADLRGVCFSSPDTGCVVGDSGVFMMTGDGGRSWTVDFAADRGWPVPFNAVCFPRRDTLTASPAPAYAVGDYGRILRVQDLSSDLPLYRFHQRSMPSGTGHLRAVCFPNGRQTGFAVGDSGAILRTRRGGRLAVDFNEQATCYEAAFRAFWGDKANPRPRPWFYGFYWWFYRVCPTPREIEYEDWLSCMTPQQKPAGEVLKSWFSAPSE